MSKQALEPRSSNRASKKWKQDARRPGSRLAGQTCLQADQKSDSIVPSGGEKGPQSTVEVSQPMPCAPSKAPSQLQVHERGKQNFSRGRSWSHRTMTRLLAPVSFFALGIRTLGVALPFMDLPAEAVMVRPDCCKRARVRSVALACVA